MRVRVRVRVRERERERDAVPPTIELEPQEDANFTILKYLKF